jgi:hypothetical protein
MEPLFSSKVFLTTFEFEDWPGIHSNGEESIRPFNGNYFDIRYKYKEVFPEPFMQQMESKTYTDHFNTFVESKKVQKIKF